MSSNTWRHSDWPGRRAGIGSLTIAAITPPISTSGSRTINQPSRDSPHASHSIRPGSQIAGFGIAPLMPSCGPRAKNTA